MWIPAFRVYGNLAASKSETQAQRENRKRKSSLMVLVSFWVWVLAARPDVGPLLSEFLPDGQFQAAAVSMLSVFYGCLIMGVRYVVQKTVDAGFVLVCLSRLGCILRETREGSAVEECSLTHSKCCCCLCRCCYEDDTWHGQTWCRERMMEKMPSQETYGSIERS